MRYPHPFTERPAPHHGWHCYDFDFGEFQLQLTTIGGQLCDPVRSHISMRNHSHPKPDFSILTFPDVISVQTAVEILRLRQNAHESGRKVGAAEARCRMREALGL